MDLNMVKSAKQGLEYFTLQQMTAQSNSGVIINKLSVPIIPNKIVTLKVLFTKKNRTYE